MVKFGKTEKAKEKVYTAKNAEKNGMLMLIIWLSQNSFKQKLIPI